MDKDDVLVRDRKRLGLSGWPIKPFLTTLCIGVPIWIAVLIPSAIFFKIIQYPFKKPKAMLEGAQPAPEATRERSLPLDQRKYDLVLFGVTGFTGRLAALYVSKQYGTGIKWAIAGRRKEALEAIRKECAAINGDLASLPILIADTSKPETVAAVVQDTRAIATTVGPFAKYGSPLVALCASYGTGYCDITGESDWVREMIDRYDEPAKQSGAKIVHFCGHDCVPWDLITMGVAKSISAKGDTISRIDIFDEMRGSASGGTLETVRLSLDARIKYKAQCGYDPMLKTPAGKSENKFTVANRMRLGFANQINKWVGPFVMAMVNANTVRRSNALCNYSPRLTYCESSVYPGFMAGFVNSMGLMIFGTCLLVPPAKWFLYKYILPKPGQGPSEKAMNAGFLKVTAFGTGHKGTTSKGMCYFPTDPGYRDTARMLVESALAISLDGHKLKCGGGVFTSAACQGEVLIDRLCATGSEFKFD